MFGFYWDFVPKPNIDLQVLEESSYMVQTYHYRGHVWLLISLSVTFLYAVKLSLRERLLHII